MTAEVRIFGTVISTYTRIIEITAEEVGLSHEVTATAARSPQNHHPFGKVPVVEVDGLELYESVSVTQYLDNAHNAGTLQPNDPAARAVMDRWIAVGNNYLFPLFEHGLIMPWIMHRHAGMPLDEENIARALPNISRALAFCDAEITKDGAWTIGAFDLADIFLYCILRGVQLTPQGSVGISQCPQLSAWMAVTEQRPSIQATRWESEP